MKFRATIPTSLQVFQVGDEMPVRCGQQLVVGRVIEVRDGVAVFEAEVDKMTHAPSQVDYSIWERVW